uniref:Rpn-3 n=1 Tax=Pristionchus pacificus TaxID=54126 RepID=A0A2A6CCR6_PRIPA|eukprot:PDM76025.1 rpn-3 [Pristionchus pacificus]
MTSSSEPSKPKTKAEKIKQEKEEAERKEREEKAKKEPKKEPELIAFETVRDHFLALDKGDTHVLGRALQMLHKTRKAMTPEILHRLLMLHSAGPVKDELVSLLPPRPTPTAAPATPSKEAAKETPMEVDGAAATAAAGNATPPPITLRISRGRLIVPDNGSRSRSVTPVPEPVVPKPEPEPEPEQQAWIRLSSQPLPSRKKTGVPPPPEAECYVHLLALIYLVDHGDKALAGAQRTAESLIKRLDEFDRRSLDGIAAKAFFYHALVYERHAKLEQLRSFLNARLRAATLRRHTETQATLIYTLLRVYLVGRQYPSAAKLVSKVSFPEGASNNDLARFLYYQGRIKAMQLDYPAASGYFLQAMRKAPQEAAIGFKQNTQKWVVVVGLLQGEIPERGIFRMPIYRKCLVPYLELCQAVRLGDLVKFNGVLQKYGQSVFEKDETLTLIVRLRQNVIKTAVRQISLAYSRISISDICKKLQLASDIETEYMVAKAISDGSIEASVTCGEPASKESGLRFMQSSETADIYRTAEPQTHFDSRIRYCLELHNQAVKALRFPPKTAEEIETIEQQREREQQELEFAKGMADEDDDDF